jgi:hypothetical protein
VVELLLNQKQVAIGLLDAKAKEPMAGAKELYATAEACGEANIKAQEDLNKQSITIAHQEQVVAARRGHRHA